MCVSASHQGLGVGHKLLTAVIDWFVARDGRELSLETNSTLAPAIALYESAGFVHARRLYTSFYRHSDVYMVDRGRHAAAPSRPRAA
jgi:putative acetyltransferase